MEFNGILAWIVFGLVAGVIAKLLTPGRDPGGCLLTMLLGVVGAFLGGFLGRLFGIYAPGEPVGLIMAVLGAIAILVLHRAFAGSPGT
jgi:uncharacterized membrane protein YeaQ/YmgE (transglycosylase-associated protein family)